ncbi:MAG: protein-disulfide reductase DsbD domain-containing protein [Flavisolibacter sp.]
MKKWLLIVLAAFTTSLSFAQDEPITWKFSSKKTSDNVYELKMTATLNKGWHLYSQNQPKDAIAIPTSFSFNKNPLLEFDGKVKEIGKMEKFVDKELDVTANQYSNEVSFVQKVKLRGKAKTNVTGKLEYQVCTDEKCLPAKTVNLSISL